MVRCANAYRVEEMTVCHRLLVLLIVVCHSTQLQYDPEGSAAYDNMIGRAKLSHENSHYSCCLREHNKLRGL